MFGIKRNATDALFSDLVRMQAKWICEYCKRNFENQKEIFDCSHYITRGNRRVRWDFENASALCRGCHHFMGMHPYEHTKFMEKKLGVKALEALIIRSMRKLSDDKIDEKFVRMSFKIELKRMKAEEKKKILGSR